MNFIKNKFEELNKSYNGLIVFLNYISIKIQNIAGMLLDLVNKEFRVYKIY